MSKDTDNASIVKKRRTRQFKTQNSTFRPAGGLPLTSFQQAAEWHTSCIHPLQELTLNISGGSVATNHFKQSGAFEIAYAQVEAEVSTRVKPPLRLANLWYA